MGYDVIEPVEYTRIAVKKWNYTYCSKQGEDRRNSTHKHEFAVGHVMLEAFVKVKTKKS